MPRIYTGYWDSKRRSPVVLNVPGLEELKRLKRWDKDIQDEIETQEYIEVRYNLPKEILLAYHYYSPTWQGWMKNANLEYGADDDYDWHDRSDWETNIKQTVLQPDEEKSFATFKRLLYELSVGFKDSMRRKGEGYVRPRSVIPKDIITEGDFVGNQNWIKKCEKFRALGNNEKLIHFAVEWKRRNIYSSMAEGIWEQMGEDGDWDTYSKLAKLRAVLTKVKDVMEMVNGIEDWDADVPLPGVDDWADERRPVKIPLYSDYHDPEWIDDEYFERDEDEYGYDDMYDPSTYDIEEVTGNYLHIFSDSEYWSEDDHSPSEGSSDDISDSAEDQDSENDAVAEDDDSDWITDNSRDEDDSESAEGPPAKRQRN